MRAGRVLIGDARTLYEAILRSGARMTDSLNDFRSDVVTATRILLQKGVLDAFGHVSVRHPSRSDRFLLSSALPPILVDVDDILEFDLDSRVIDSHERPLYGERFIHGCLYALRPDVNAVCHHHCPSIMPFCVTATPLVAVSQTGAAMGPEVPVWDSRDEFGDTNLLIANSAQGESLARALGGANMVLMRRHGACVVGGSLRELVFRAVYACQDAETQCRAAALGMVQALTPAERALAGAPRDASIERCWRHWTEQYAIHTKGAGKLGEAAR